MIARAQATRQQRVAGGHARGEAQRCLGVFQRRQLLRQLADGGIGYPRVAEAVILGAVER